MRVRVTVMSNTFMFIPILRSSSITHQIPLFFQNGRSFGSATGVFTRDLTSVKQDCHRTIKSHSQFPGQSLQNLSVRGFKIGVMHTANSQTNKGPRKTSSNTLVETSEQSGAASVSLGEKVKENVKTASYGGVILLGLAVTGAMAYVILSELFSGDSPNNIYTKSFKLCKASQEVQDSLGNPIKCYGEETRRGWRRHVAHQEFFQGNTKYLRMKFYVEGQFKKGTVHVEKKTNDKGKYEYSYLMVDVEGYPPRRIEVDVSNF